MIISRFVIVIGYVLWVLALWCATSAAAPAVSVLRPGMPALTTPAAVVEPDYASLEQDRFIAAVNQFLLKEGIDPGEVSVEFRPLRSAAAGTTGNWRALAQVHVDANADGKGYAKRLVFDRDYWLNPNEPRRFQDHRWVKLMWHEIHHLNGFPKNLKKADELKEFYPRAAGVSDDQWKKQWIALLEPMEEMDAERECLTRYRAVFGAVPESLMFDSRADMRKHAARYQQLLADILAHTPTPDAVTAHFPAKLPIDSDGNIL
jgi:hypothetical protein